VTATSALTGMSHVNERHKWTALFITTLGMLMATIDASIVLIALPDIFRGIHLDPLLPSNTFFLLRSRPSSRPSSATTLRATSSARTSCHS
jgi:hypothetical protein